VPAEGDTTHIPLEQEPRWAGLQEVLRMTGPIVLGSLSFTIMHFVDGIMVAHTGEAALAAVGTAGLWSATFSALLGGIVGIVSTFVSQSVGRNETHNCARYTWQGLHLSILFGILALGLWPLAPYLFGIMKHDPEVMEIEIVYYKIRLLGYGFIFWGQALTGFFQGVGRPVIPMYAAFVGNVLNIVLDYALIFGHWGFPAMGAEGAAIATVIGLFVQGVVMHLFFAAAPFRSAYATCAAWAIDWPKIKEILRIGIPSGLHWFMDLVIWGIFTSFIVGKFGKTPLAAHNAAINCMHLSFMVALGLSHGVAPIVGQWIGRGDYRRAKARTYTALKLGMAYMVFVGIGFALFGRWIMADVYNNDSAEFIHIGYALLLLAAAFQAFDAVNIVVGGGLRGAGDTRWLAYLTVGGGYFVFLPAAWFIAFPLEGGVIGAWIGATIYIIGLSGLIFARFHGEKWRDINIFSNDYAAAGEGAD
jgi:MATE family multidrug resistance protein